MMYTVGHHHPIMSWNWSLRIFPLCTQSIMSLCILHLTQTWFIHTHSHNNKPGPSHCLCGSYGHSWLLSCLMGLSELALLFIMFQRLFLFYYQACLFYCDNECDDGTEGIKAAEIWNGIRFKATTPGVYSTFSEPLKHLEIEIYFIWLCMVIDKMGYVLIIFLPEIISNKEVFLLVCLHVCLMSKSC